MLLSGTNAYKPRKSNKPAFFYGSGITKIRKIKKILSTDCFLLLQVRTKHISTPQPYKPQLILFVKPSCSNTRPVSTIYVAEMGEWVTNISQEPNKHA